MVRAAGLHLLTAHGGGAVEQAPGSGHGHQRGDLGPAARLAEDHHARGIAAKTGDIGADPLQRRDQVKLAQIAAVGIARPEGL
jgi:hypothetical protein